MVTSLQIGAATMSVYLPQGVLGDIFLRLPRKTIGCCSCVCRSWRSVITNPNFIHNHFMQTESKRNDTDDDLLLLWRFSLIDKRDVYSLHADTDKLDRVKNLDCPFEISNCRIVGYCNGVLCLSFSDDSAIGAYKFLLWNPSIRQYLYLPYPFESYNSRGVYNALAGFGFDSISCDYKVVMVTYEEKKDERLARVHVYSLNTNSWSDTSAKITLFYSPASYGPQVATNGYIHWLASICDRSWILRFDVAREGFDEMSLPENLVYTTDRNLSLTVLGGELSVVYINKRCEIWTMKEYCVKELWTKQFEIRLGSSDIFESTLVFVRNSMGLNGNHNLILEIQGSLVSYCCESRSLSFADISGSDTSFYMNRYTESLVLLGKGDTNLKRHRGRTCSLKKERPELVSCFY